jgi:signal transduction histidine kinase
VQIQWAKGLRVPDRLEPLAQATLGEALRNAIRHARPTSIDVRVESVDDTFILEVVNDGVREGPGSTATGMGLRLASLEALQFGGVVEFGAHEKGGWRTRLVVPL